MALFGQDQVDPRIAAGGAALGDLIMGGPGDRAESVYVDQFKKNADAADAMWQARDRRARAIAREGIKDSVATAGYDPKLAPLVSNVLTTAATPNLRNLGDFADPADRVLDQQRQEAMAKGDVALYNRLTAVATDKAYQPARVVGGNIMRDGVGLGDEAFEIVPLPQTLATIEAAEARTEATRARIAQGQERTDAYVRRQDRPPAPRGGKPSSVEAPRASGQIVDVSSADEARAAWAKLTKGDSLRFPNGTIKRKE